MANRPLVTSAKDIPRELRRAYKAAREQRWAVHRTGSGHLLWRPPQGEIVITAVTCGGGRGHGNAISRLRSSGLRLS